MVVPTTIHRLGAHRVAVERGLAEHLRELRSRLQPHFRRIAVIAPTCSAADYERAPQAFEIVDEVDERLTVIAAHPTDAGTVAFWLRHFVPNLLRIADAVRRSAVVQASTSAPRRPFEIVALLLAALWRRPRICVEDFDRPEPPAAQLRLAVRCSSMVLLPSERQALAAAQQGADVRSFLRTPIRSDRLIPSLQLQRKLASLRIVDQPLRLAFLAMPGSGGGFEHAIAALAKVWRSGATGFRLRVIGSGADQARLEGLATGLGLHDVVEFVAGGSEQLQDSHMLLATAPSECSPAHALMAMAAGVPVLAFDVAVYADLQRTGAVTVVPVLAIEALAARIAGLVRGKGALAHMVQAAITFARRNTRDIWIERRVDWTLELLGLAPMPSPPVSRAPAPVRPALDSVPAPFDSGTPAIASPPAMPALPGSSQSADRLP